MKSHLDIRVIDHPLQNLAVHLEEGGPERLGFAYGSADRPLKGFPFYRTLESHEQAQLPTRIELTHLLSKPYFQLSPGQRKCPVPKHHRLL